MDYDDALQTIAALLNDPLPEPQTLSRQRSEPALPSQSTTANLSVQHLPRRHRSSSHIQDDMEIHEMTPIREMDMFTQLESKDLALSQFPAKGMVGTYDNPLNPFLDLPADSALNPKCESFNAQKWVTNLVGFIMQDPARYAYETSRLSVCFSNLDVHGFGSPTDYQKTVPNVILELGEIFRCFSKSRKEKVQILQGFDGVVDSGEMLLVLGRPGSGCSTLLKTISGDTKGFFVAENSSLNYRGITAKQMQSQFRGEAIYMAENDVHINSLTVGQTLRNAAMARAPRDFTFPGVTRKKYSEHMTEVMMATFGIMHTKDTKVAFISGGETKRVSIAEAMLSGSPIQCWDNSTRGLDSANALEFCKNLRLTADMFHSTILVSLYQGSEDTYEVFDKVTVLYEGKQIYFGESHQAKAYFVNMGFECMPRQTTADFLTSLTNPSERRVRPGFEHRTPRTPDEFVLAWKRSPAYKKLRKNIFTYESKFPIGGKSVDEFKAARRLRQSKHQHVGSAFTMSILEQISWCVTRGFQRLKGDASVTISNVIGNSVLALIVGSIFYDLKNDTGSFYSRPVCLFFSILLNAFSSSLELITLYEQRPVTEKHARYAFCHPFAEAAASAIVDLPYKICNSISFNLFLYFMTDLRREPGAFFTFLAFSFSTTLALSMVFRTIGASSRTLAQALAPAALFILSLMVYTGFVIPINKMVPWFRWINFIDPIAYAFESLMINEFDGRHFPCSSFVPSGPQYQGVGPLNHICAVVGAVAGSNVVSGTEFIRLGYSYNASNLWRNLVIILAIFVFFTFTYLFASEYITEKKSKGEVLLFPRGLRPTQNTKDDLEHLSRTSSPRSSAHLSNTPRRISAFIHKQTSIFHWRNICYDIRVKKEDRRILDHVDGWVKPGTLTALMGPSGAGKTTLLDVLATRDTAGTASGSALVDGQTRDISFQRKTGYSQQQDVYLETLTVRETLQFNALMCQPRNVSRKDKLAYVDTIINLLDMGYYADAIVGVPGEGLNIEQRKKLNIAVELAAKPKLLLFLDEPTSGLDSQTSWAILDLLRKLNLHGQAILCTIHQPSGVLFQRFDRLLLLAPGGRPAYFGDIGPSATTVISYFERNGAKACPANGNPAEWIMEVLGCAPGHHSTIDWPEVWRNSPEYSRVHSELDSMELRAHRKNPAEEVNDDHEFDEFAAPFSAQLWECFKRVNIQYWRTPSYIYSKIALSLLTSLFLGFSFYQTDNSLQGLQNQIFSIFMLLTQAANLVPQILPNFVAQRTIFEARERSAKTYSWQVFLLSNILVEIPWNTLMSVFIFASWYFPIGFYRNSATTALMATNSVVILLFIWGYMMYMSTFAHMMQAGVDLAAMAGNYANLLFMLSLIFCGILVAPDALPGFWIFMYRVSPYNYLVGAILSVSLANAEVRCSSIELLHFEPPNGATCSSYMESFIKYSGGYLKNPDAITDCAYCPLSASSTFLKTFGIEYANRWRSFAIIWVFILVNICGAFFFYWLARVPQKRKYRNLGNTEKDISSEESEEIIARQDEELEKVEKRKKNIVDEGISVDRGGSSQGASRGASFTGATGGSRASARDCEL
ncbi:hypothetical protein HYFRA_00008157 [Hymenoscyphus fraxineus]|uniref:ABC transporter domain-containing protein n=1 Tax=Hymenoscyphus fraxineus TaxID=746836 RepID=A0A9N9L9D5_9HELO|nr:hypothetical protein HYFRA_00008157 [Hymenoscyphus fraxineus]